MKASYLILLLSAIMLCPGSMYAVDDNVVISRLGETYTLKAGKDGSLVEVKAVITKTFKVNRADDSALAYEFYSSETPINKASAPGVKPVYRSMESDDMFFSGSRICALPLELKPGKPVTARFEKDYKALEQFGAVVIAESYFIEQARIEIVVPSSLIETITVEACDLPATATFTNVTDAKGNMVYTLETAGIPAAKNEKYAASAICSAPRLIVSGLFTTLDDLYKFMRVHLDGSETAPEVVSLAREITSSCADDLERIDVIASWVRNNIRYVGIEHGDYGKRPDTAGNVLSKRYGDCKGSANLICRMMRACGIDGRLVWIGTRGHVIGPYSKYKDFGCGNHMIAAAVLGDSIVYVDGTVTFAPRRFLPYHIAGCEAIVENGDSYMLTTLPEYDNDRYITEVTGCFRVAGNSLEGDIAMTLRGHDRVVFENNIAGLSPNKRLSYCHLFLAPTKSATYDNIVISTDAPDAATTHLSAREKDGKAIVPATSRLYVSLHPLRFGLPDPVDADGRMRPVSTGVPRNISTSMTFEMPDGYDADRLPDDIHVDNPWFKGDLCYRRDGNTVTVNGQIKNISTEASVDSIKLWNEAVKELNRINNETIVLTSTL